MTAKPWKLVLLLTGIFLAGGVAGSFLTVRFGRHLIEKRPGPDQWAPARLKFLAEKLDLTKEQQEKLKPILRRDMDELGRIRDSSFEQSRVVFERMERDISAVLTPEQREKLEQLNKQRRERLQKLLPKPAYGQGLKGERQPRREGPPGGPEGEPPPPPPPDGK